MTFDFTNFKIKLGRLIRLHVIYCDIHVPSNIIFLTVVYFDCAC